MHKAVNCHSHSPAQSAYLTHTIVASDNGHRKTKDKFAFSWIVLDTRAQLDTDMDQCKNLDEDFEDTEDDGDDHQCDQVDTETPVFDEDPTWTPEEVDEAYVKLGDDCDDKKDTDSGYIIV